MNTLETIKEKCIECPLCKMECRFLQKYGTPKAIADHFDSTEKKSQTLPFECSLCGLCAAVCPVAINPAQMFLEMRQAVVRQEGGDFSEYAPLLQYERRGTSKKYTYYGFPDHCQTVIFPGCALAGTRPDKVLKVFESVSKTIPNLGIVLDCCTKPSHDLGREGYFIALFGEMRKYLLGHGINTVLVACPNCFKMFKEYGDPIQVRTVYEILAEAAQMHGKAIPAPVTVHDPCVTRFEKPIQDAVRNLIQAQGGTIEEMEHQGAKTLCCGEGGAVNFITPDLAGNWGTKLKSEARGKRILTYCAGCADVLNKLTPTDHILDFYYKPEATLSGKVKVSKTPITYWNRLRLKKRFRKIIPGTVTRERIFQPKGKPSHSLLVRILILLFLAGGIAGLKISGAGHYLDQDFLTKWVREAGILAPLVYMLLYTIAPVFFLPGLPITFVGGLIFDPYWGVVYTIFGATAGACLAFLVSRYLARRWVEKKLRSPRWRKLDEQVEAQGWKVVLFTRMIPLFPFNLLNYAFGLTKIRFSHYTLATFWGMLPACISFIFFSSSFWDLIRGKVSPFFLIGLLFIILISLIPFLFKKYWISSELGQDDRKIQKGKDSGNRNKEADR